MIKTNRPILFSSLFALTLLVIIVGVIAFMTYHTVLRTIDMELEAEAHRIEHTLSSTFEEVQSLMIFTGKRMAKKNIQDLQVIWEEIHEILGLKKIHEHADWPNIGWLNDNNIQIVNATYGIHSDPQNLSFRKYTEKARQMPWKLHFDAPALSVPSNILSINSGLGVLDVTGKFLGVFGASFDINELTKQVNRVMRDSDIQFAVYNENAQLIIKSASDEHFLNVGPWLEKGVERARKIDFAFNQISEEETPLVSRWYTKHLSHFPFTVITYVDWLTIKKEWIHNLKPHLLELGVVAIAFFLISLFFWEKFQTKNKELDATRAELEYAFSLAKASDAAKEEFLRRTNVEMVMPLTAIKSLTTLLRKNLNGEVDTELSLERQKEIYQEILDHAQDFKNLTNHVLNLTKVDIQEIIRDCVTIHSKAVFEKGIQVVMTFPDSMPLLICDEVKIKQIFVRLISRAIRYSPMHEKLNISAHLQMDDNRKFIQITLEDKGFVLSEETFVDETIDDDLNFNLSSIERLVLMHRGELWIENKQGKGTLTMLRLPLDTQEKSAGKVTPIPDELTII